MRRLTLLSILLVLAAVCVACGTKTSEQDTKPTATAAPTDTPTPSPEPATPTPTPVHASIATKIPSVYQRYRVKDGGSIEEIAYETHDYLNADETVYTKPAFVYLPPDYDPSKKYNVLYLMHGIGGNEREWGMTGLTSTVKALMDNLIHYGDIEPFIVVAPNVF